LDNDVLVVINSEEGVAFVVVVVVVVAIIVRGTLAAKARLQKLLKRTIKSWFDAKNGRHYDATTRLSFLSWLVWRYYGHQT
jgi:hypothetical protein